MSNIFSRIAIGCANWDMPYNGSQLSDKDITKVLGYCQTSGIDTLDMSTAYGNDFNRPNSYFKKIVKVRMCDDIENVAETEPYCLMAHDKETASHFLRSPGVFYKPKIGLSVYDKTELLGSSFFEVIQLPYSLYDRRFEYYFQMLKEMKYEIHVRSIFLRGRILKDGIEPCEAIKFCLCNPYIDKVIIGVDSFEQLQRNLDFLHRWANLERHDDELLDTRQWKE